MKLVYTLLGSHCVKPCPIFGGLNTFLNDGFGALYLREWPFDELEKEEVKEKIKKLREKSVV